MTAKTLAGSYAAMIKYRDVVTAGIAGSGNMLTTIVATAEIRDDPEQGARLSVTLCDARTTGANTKHLQDLIMTIPQAALSKVQLDPAALEVMRAAGAVTWKTSELRGPAGWKWSSPTDALPELEDDPRVFDQDADGNPGVTTDFTGEYTGALYLATVYRFTFSGTIAANGDLTGTTTSTSRETFLGSDQLLLLGTTIERVADSNTADNTIRLTRQPAALNCDQVIAQKETLFP